jgi:solute carrier family 40 (iron-regulated transporter), member 1
LALGVLEKLSGVANMISMERDWVVTVAAEDGRAYDLTRLNAVMRRIDLICKLVAPIVISIIISRSGSVRVGVVVVGGISAISWVLEWWSARSVWKSHAGLRQPKIFHSVDESQDSGSLDRLPALERVRSHTKGLIEKITHGLNQFAQDIKSYFSSEVWIPSLALSLLHISVLAYSATFITYLLNVGFSLNLITIARAVGSVVEISSTVVTPFGVDYLGKAHHHHRHRHGLDDDGSENELLEEALHYHGSTETGLERLGLWGITWQLLNLVCSLTAVLKLSFSRQS